MVDVTGHVAFGLLFALPAWVRWRGRTSVVFVALVAGASLLPDVDVWLSRAFPAAVHHHGVTHTVVFVVLASVTAGAVVTTTLGSRVVEWTNGERSDGWRLFGFVTAALVLGGLSHLFADVLSAPDVSTPVEPFWPFFAKPWAVDVVWYDSVWVNPVFLVGVSLLHLVVYLAVDPFGHRRRVESASESGPD